MGFECGFNKVRKYKSKGFKVEDVKLFLAYETYLSWKNNPWNFEINESTGEAPYPTFDKYVDRYYDKDNPDYDDLRWFAEYLREDALADKLEFYQNQPHDLYSYYRNIEFWCSSGHEYLDEYVTEKLHRVSGETYDGITMEFIDEALDWVEKKLEESEATAYSVVASFKANDDDSKIITPCDGIVVTPYDDVNSYEILVRTNVDDFMTFPVYIRSDESNELAYNTYLSFKIALLRMKDALETDDYILWYYRSW